MNFPDWINDEYHKFVNNYRMPSVQTPPVRVPDPQPIQEPVQEKPAEAEKDEPLNLEPIDVPNDK